MTTIVFSNTNLFGDTTQVTLTNSTSIPVSQAIERSVIQWVTNRVFVVQTVGCLN